MAERLWNDEYLVRPRIFCFAAGWVTAYVDVSPLSIEGLKTYPGLPGTGLAVGNVGCVEEEVRGDGEKLDFTLSAGELLECTVISRQKPNCCRLLPNRVTRKDKLLFGSNRLEIKDEMNSGRRD